MKQRLLRTITLVFALLFSVSACTGSPSGPTTTPTPTTAEETILVWWNLFEPQENVQPLIDAYEAAHPNVKIQYDQRGVRNGVSGYRSELDTVLNDKNPLSTPDIFTIHNTWTVAYEDFIGKAPASAITTEELADFYPVVRSDFAYDGTFALPVYMDALAVIYNKQKLQEALYTFPSDDWLEFATMAKNLTKRDSSNRIVSAGFSAVIPENTQFASDLLNLLMLQNGVNMTDSTRTNAIFATNPEENAKAEEALQFYQQFVSGSATWDESLKLDVAAFLEKKLAMYAAPSWRLIDILEYNKEYNLGLEVGVAPMPQLGSLNNDEEIYWPTYWGLTVAKDSSTQAIAWDFIEFITQPEQLRLLNTTVKQNGRPLGILYPRSSMSGEITSEASTSEFMSPYVQAISNAQNWRVPDGDKVKEQFNMVLTGQSDLEEAESVINDLYKKED